MGIIPVNRKIHDKNALNSAIDILNENKVIGIFPEGTINKTKDIFLLPFKYFYYHSNLVLYLWQKKLMLL